MKEQINNIRNALGIVTMNVNKLEEGFKGASIDSPAEITSLAKKIKLQIEEQPIGGEFDSKYADKLFIDMGQLLHKILH